MKKSRFIHVLILASALLFIAGCGGKSDADEAIEGAEDAVEEAGDAIRDNLE